MIKTRLIRLLSHTRKYIIYVVLCQWAALLAQIIAVFTITGLLETAMPASLTAVETAMTSTLTAGKTAMPPALTAGKTAMASALTARSLLQAAAILAAAVVIRFACDRLAARASYAASVDVKRILRERIYEKLLRLGISYREQVSTSEIVQMSAEGVEQLETYFGKYLPQLFYSLLAPLTLFAVLAPVNLKASLVLLVCVPLIPVSIVAVQKLAKRLLDKYWGIYTGLGDSFLENLQGLTTLKIYQADGQKAMEMDEESQNFRKITMKVLTMQLNSTSVMDIVAYGGAAIGMIVAAGEFLAGRLSFAGALSILLLASEFFIPLRLLGSFFHIAMNGMAASDKIFRLLDLEEPEPGTRKLPEGKLDIRLSGVHFSYEKDREILKGIDLNLPAGTFLSLVGESGCGKSTIAGLLAGKNRGYQGEILIGQIPLSDIREEELTKHVTLVRHNSYLFKGTVEENLRMAKADATEQELWAALTKVNLKGFLEAQQGLLTPVLERGGNFSGGQCQRLALARALLHDTPVYIFDEATSNIDADSEDLIMQVIHELARSKTVLLISHRLCNVVKSDCIYLLKEGRIAQSGTHEELMKQGGAYAELYRRQMELEQFGLAGSPEKEARPKKNGRSKEDGRPGKEAKA